MNSRDIFGIMGLALMVGLASRAIVSGTQTAAVISAIGTSFSGVIHAATSPGL